MSKVIPIVQRNTQSQPAPISRLPTGLLTLDLALDGGLPMASIVEITGKAHSGKTTLALQILGQAQKAALTATLISGTPLPPERYLRACGIDTETLVVPSVRDTMHLNGALETAVAALKKDNALVVIDPLPAFPTRAELELEECDVGQKWSRNPILDVGYRLICATLRIHPNSLLIVVNQKREKPGVLFGDPWRETSHEITDHFQVRLDLIRIQAVKEAGRVIGSRIKARVKKHAGGTPFTEAEFEILAHTGPDPWASILDVALACGAAERSNGHYLLGDKPLGANRDEAKVALAARHHQLHEHLPAPAARLLPEPTIVNTPVALQNC